MGSDRKTVLFLCGGKSDEHEISLISTKCVLDALDRDRFSPLVVGISKAGIWYFEEEKTFFQGECRADRIRLNESAPQVSLQPYLSPKKQGVLEAAGRQVAFDVVFPILHGPFGEDGTMQGLLEIIGIPYVGSGCGSSWNCMDKVLTKTLCAQAGLAVVDYVSIASLGELQARLPEIERLGHPVFVKPARLGSSVGISKVQFTEELEPAVKKALKLDDKVLIERGIDAREIECAVLGNPPTARASLPGEILVAPKIGWYSYEAKYLMKDAATTLAPAPLDSAQTRAVQEFALSVYRVLECRGMARVDLFLERSSGRLLLNEVNTIPGFTPISMYPKMWEVSGVSYRQLITNLLELAQNRA